MEQQTHPLVYCIILNFNGKKLLLETLESVSAMDYSNYKIIVVDNGSVDGSQDAVREQFPQIPLIENGSNLGFGEGNNVGMRYALEHNADWVLLLNNDIAVAPDMLTEFVSAAMSDSSIGVLGAKIYYYSESDTLWYAGGKVNYWTGVISHRGLRQKDTGAFDTTEDTGYVTGCAMMLRRETIEKVGMFDPIYFPAYSEDADLSIRAKRGGYRLVYVPNAKVWHKVSSSSGGGTTPFKTKLKVEHNLIFFKRYARWYHWITIPICVGSVGAVFVVKELFKGNFSIISALAQGTGNAMRRLF